MPDPTAPAGAGRQYPYCAFCETPLAEHPEPLCSPDDLRDRIRDTFGPAMKLGLQNAELFDEPGAQRIEEWIESITNGVLGVVTPELDAREMVAERRLTRIAELNAELERLRAELAALRIDETDVDWLADHVRTAVHYVLGRIEPRLDSKVRTEAAEQASIHIKAGSVPFVNACVMDLAIDLIKQAEAERDALKAAIETALRLYATHHQKVHPRPYSGCDACRIGLALSRDLPRKQDSREDIQARLAALATPDTAPETPEASDEH